MRKSKTITITLVLLVIIAGATTAALVLRTPTQTSSSNGNTQSQDQTINDTSMVLTDYPQGWAEASPVNWKIYFPEGLNESGGPSFSFSNGSSSIQLEIMMLKYNTTEEARSDYETFKNIMMNNSASTGYSFSRNYSLGYGSVQFDHSGAFLDGTRGKDLFMCKGQFVIDMRWYFGGSWPVDDSMAYHYLDVQASKIK
jgi:hypothetical protein